MNVNMGTPAEELTLALPLGIGSSGRAFGSVKPNVATFEAGWAADVLPPEDMKKIHPDLSWVVSVPITTGQPPATVWVLNVDGISEPRTKEKLEAVLADLINYGQALAVVVSRLIDRRVKKVQQNQGEPDEVR
jgi:hypothetical protein